MSKAAAAVAATGQLQQELAALRQQNQQLRAELEAVRAERVELGTRSRRPTRSGRADQAADRGGAQLSELRDSLQQAEQEKARAGADLARIQGELASAQEQAAAAGQERAQSGQRAAALEDERDELRIRLADATARLGWSEAARTQLEREVAELREAAGTAAADARQNLIAVETRIKELNEALAAIAPAAGSAETDPTLRPRARPLRTSRRTANGALRAAPAERAAAVAAPRRVPNRTTPTAICRGPRRRARRSPASHRTLTWINGVFSAADLLFSRSWPICLWTSGSTCRASSRDLHSKLDERGLMTTVPGELLFAVGSDEVQASAYDTLVKVAELISLYDDRQVLISGHSDSDGNAADNQRLSERRAEVVKQFFVDNFDLAPDRLSTEGLGEARPIASNATPQGRRANRRVEVLILN